jgi:hypothetical protein
MKAWYKSKTLWFNVITLILGILGAIAGIVESRTAIVVLVAFEALGNGVLRIWFTDTAIGIPAQTPAAPSDGTQPGVPGS